MLFPCAGLRRMQRLTAKHRSFPLAQGPLPALRATFSGDVPGIPRFAPVRGATSHAKTYSQASFFPVSSRTSSGPSGHLLRGCPQHPALRARARGRLRALSHSQITEKYEPQAVSPQGEGGPRSGGRGPWTCRIQTKQMTSPVWRRTPQGEGGPRSGGRGP